MKISSCPSCTYSSSYPNSGITCLSSKLKPYNQLLKLYFSYYSFATVIHLANPKSHISNYGKLLDLPLPRFSGESHNTVMNEKIYHQPILIFKLKT